MWNHNAAAGRCSRCSCEYGDTDLQRTVRGYSSDLPLQCVLSPSQLIIVLIGVSDFPVMVPLWSLPPAVVTGNCMILKPSERDPGACIILAELAREAGFPPGVINIVHGGAPTVDFIIDEPAIKAISFVGSNKAGEYIYRRASENGKRVQANLGAKNHAAILPDANKNHAINATVGAAFGAAGQRCMALSAVVTVGNTKDWLPELAEKARALKVDGGFEKGADIGPLISPQAKERIEGLITSAEEEGATVLVDGRNHKNDKYPNGNFVSLSRLFSLSSIDTFTLSAWSNPHNKRQTSHAVLYRRDLRPCPRLSTRRHPRRSSRTDKRQPLRQRRRHLHALRCSSKSFPKERRSWTSRPERADPGTHSGVQLHWE